MFTKWLFGLDKTPQDNFGWTMDINYTYNYNKQKLDASSYQSFNLIGKVQLTKKTEFNYRLPVNLKTKNFAKEGYLNFTRNLHCWEMKMNWFPFQDGLFCTFTISPKASMLKNIIPPKTFNERIRN